MIINFILNVKYFICRKASADNKKVLLNFNQQTLYRDNDIAQDEDVCSEDIGKDIWDFSFPSLNAFLLVNSSYLSDSSDRSNFHSVIQIMAIQAGILYSASFLSNFPSRICEFCFRPSIHDLLPCCFVNYSILHCCWHLHLTMQNKRKTMTRSQETVVLRSADTS